nr:hypothetical protein [Tanacetum cinerariifolium]
MDSTNKDYISSVLESVKANSLASKISNIDGKIFPRRYTTYQEPLKDADSSKSNISNVKDKTANTILKKDEIKRVPVWVKMHHVTIVAYSDVGLSLISTQIGKPLMLDSYTSNMCLNSWGRSAYAREGHTFATIDIEYEWTPPRCASCRIFDHVSEKCPKLPKVASSEKVIEEGFIERVDKGKLSKINNGVANKESTDRGPIQITTKNSFSALSEETDTNLKDNEGVNADGQTPIESQFVNDSDEDVINDNKLSMCAILESHVATHNLERLCKHVFKNWNWISNAMSCLKGTRIIVGWNQNDVDVTVIHQDPQVIHARIWIKADRKEFFLLFCDTSIGSSSLDVTMREFKECVENMEVMDVQRTGLQYTWNQKPKGKDGILRKLDRVLANLEFLDVFMGVHAVFKPYRISDHSPAVLSIPSLVKVKPMPFKFFNVIILDNMFKDVVRNAWMAQISGFYMFRVVKKLKGLKGLKKPIRKLMFDKGNLHANVTRLRGELDKVQTDLDCDPSNFSLREKEAMTVADFNEALLMEEKFLKQKAKISWLKEGDSNTAYFHKVVKSRVSQNRIDVVMDAYGNVHHSTEVAKAFINHYELFLGQPGNTSAFNTDNLFPTTLNENEALNMVSDISSQEVKSAMFSMGNDKSPGPDGFTAAFFKDTWDIIGVDVIKAVKEFFTNGRLLKELNHTIIALIPKVNSPARVTDYRPISCCNVLFKCISKIIANRLKGSLKRL